jgi:hypothetical protein
VHHAEPLNFGAVALVKNMATAQKIPATTTVLDGIG